MLRNKSHTIIGEDLTVSNDSFTTNLNNNVLICGPSGAGKTRGFVIPNILASSDESLVVTDTKGELYRKLSGVLRQRGYQVYLLDFTGEEESTIGYNPLDNIYDYTADVYDERDVLKLCAIMVPVEDDHDPFWYYAARQYLSILVSYMVHCLPMEEHNLETLAKLFRIMQTDDFPRLMDKLAESEPDCFPVQQYQLTKMTKNADRMHASIFGILGTSLSNYLLKIYQKLSTKNYRLTNFQKLRLEKSCLFINVSDTDRSADKILNLFYSQLFQNLCNYPKYWKKYDYPVRLILDDFASGAGNGITDFDKIISITRSRDISLNIILQDFSQLNGLYGEASARTIINNCDRLLYLGGTDMETTKEISTRTNLPQHQILSMPQNEAFFFERGCQAKRIHKYDFEKHSGELYAVDVGCNGCREREDDYEVFTCE